MSGSVREGIDFAFVAAGSYEVLGCLQEAWGAARNFLVASTMEMFLAIAVPGSDGKGSSLLQYEQQVLSGCQEANLEAANRASDLIVQMGSVARQVFTPTEEDITKNNDAAQQILHILRECVCAGRD